MSMMALLYLAVLTLDQLLELSTCDSSECIIAATNVFPVDKNVWNSALAS